MLYDDAHLNVFSDVTLVCGKSEFAVHGLSLQVIIFQDSLCGACNGRQVTSDLSPQILGAIVNSTYTGEVDNIDYISLELFLAAEMYQ